VPSVDRCALAAFAVWEEWLNLFAGLWLIVAPRLLGFQDSNAMTIDLVIGTVVAALAALEMWLAVDRRQGGPTWHDYAGLRCWTGRGSRAKAKVLPTIVHEFARDNGLPVRPNRHPAH
jgi:hypothetical protein